MTTTTVLVKTLTGLCGGQCGGEITLVTDTVTEAYAVVEPARDTRFVQQDCGNVERRQDGSIVVHCAAVDPEAEQGCDGSATFGRADLADVAYMADALANFMHAMDQQ